jgi:hypothetical protein
MPVVAVALSLLVTWAICRALWGRRVAIIAAALVALDPSWVFYLTRDVGPAALAVLLKLLAVAAGIGWWRHGRSARGRLWLAGGALLLGLGVSHKVDFLWIVAGLLVPMLVLAGRSAARRLDLGSGLLAAATFLVGAAPIVAFNIVTGGRTFTPFVAKLVSGDGTGDSPGVLSALLVRLRQLAELPTGATVERLFTATLGATDGTLWLRLLPTGAVVAASVWLVVCCWRRRPGSRLHAALLLHMAVVLAASCFSPTALNAHHLLTLYPAVHIVVAIAIARLLQPTAGAGTHLLGTLVLTSVLLANAASVVQIHRALHTTGGVGYWSDAIVELANDLERRLPQRSTATQPAGSLEPVRVMDWGFTNNLIVLTEGRVPLEPVYRRLWRHPPSLGVVEPTISAGALYLLHAPELTLYEELPPLLDAAASRHGLAPVVEASYGQRDGRTVYRLVRLRRHSPRVDHPPTRERHNAPQANGALRSRYELP